MLGGREACQFEWTAPGPTGTVEGRTRGDVRRLQAVHSPSLLAGKASLVHAREDSVLRAAQGKSGGTLASSIMFGAEEIGLETDEIEFLSETQYMKDIFNSMDVEGSPEGTYFRGLEEVFKSEFTCVRNGYQVCFCDE